MHGLGFEMKVIVKFKYTVNCCPKDDHIQK